jgi:hypothetical protein
MVTHNSLRAGGVPVLSLEHPGTQQKSPKAVLVLPNIFGSVFWSKQSIDSIMEALINPTGTPPGPDGIALWVTMKNYIISE